MHYFQKKGGGGVERMERVWNAKPVRLVREMAGIYFSVRVDSAAAALSYFLILSLFPLLICLNAFVGVLRINVASVLRVLSTFLPPSLLGVVEDYLGYVSHHKSAAMLAAGVVMTLFFASGAMRTLMNIMDAIYGRQGFRGVAQVVVSVVFSLLLLLAMYLSIFVVLTGNWFLHLLERYLPFSWLSGLWDWQWFKFLLLFAVVFFVVVALYLLSAPPGRPRPPVFLGAFLASAALVGASWVFSVFIGMSSRYSLIYGSLASVIILLVWLYVCGNVLILGNVFNCVRYRWKKEKKLEKNP